MPVPITTPETIFIGADLSPAELLARFEREREIWPRCQCGRVYSPSEYKAGFRSCEKCPDPEGPVAAEQAAR